MTKLVNLARVTTTTTGTGTVTLGGAVSGYLTFAQAGVANGDTVWYSLRDANGGAEVGIGTYTGAGTTLSRDTVLRSTGAANTGKISLSGSAEVIVTFLAETLAPIAISGSASDLSTGTIPSGRVSGGYTGITDVGTLSAGINITTNYQIGGTTVLDNAGWTGYTPTVTANSGAYGPSSPVAEGAYKQIGKTVFIRVSVTVPAIGTADYPILTLPVTAVSVKFPHYFLHGREAVITGSTLTGFLSDTTHVFIVKYDNLSPLTANNVQCRVSGFYEAA